MLIQEYQERWREDFRSIKTVISETLDNCDVTIEHIGSTAVPQLAAKPIIDIDVVYAKSDEFDTIKAGLEHVGGVGYVHKGNQGISQREVFKRHSAAKAHPILDSIAHHLYVCPIDSKELQRHILFRDYLIKHEAARVQYQALKYEIADEVSQDRKKYAQVKEVKVRTFVEAIIAKAQEENIGTSLSR